MADDNTLRTYRSNDPYRRGDAAADNDERPRASDPLAELARLIGQSDPFGEFARADAGPAAGRAPRDLRDPPRAAAVPLGAPDWRRNAMPSQATPRAQPAAVDAPVSPASSSYQRRDPHQMVSGGERLDELERDYLRSRDHDGPQFLGAHGSQHPSPLGSQVQHDADVPAAVGSDGQQNEAFLDDGVAMGPHDDEIYDDAPPSRWRRGAATAATIIVCAVLGSAGAYAYRSYSTGARATQAPPVITAEKAPTKVVPANDPQSGKTIQDRVREQGPNERVVSREEQPVELRNMITTAPSRVVMQGAQAPSQAQASSLAQASMLGGVPASVGSLPPTAASPSAAGNEPKRVRTVTIRPDGTDLSGRPVGSLGPSAGLTPVTSTRGTTPPPAARAAAPAPTRNGDPISLDPQAPASEPPPAARERATAAVPPPTRLAAAPANGAGGGYLVQLSSQKSDAEAQASIRTLQAKYPHLLNGRAPTVQRADLGAKGVFYRAVVGPFGSSGEADSLCNGLKAAGGQCIVQRN